MLNSIFGEIKTFVNGKISNPKIIELCNKGKNYIVDKRYKLIIDIKCMDKNEVKCILQEKKDDIKSSCESGQALELISLYFNNNKLSIGTEGEIPNIKYNYIQNGIELIISKQSNICQVIFGVAWLEMKNPDVEDIYTWFAADPTLF